MYLEFENIEDILIVHLKGELDHHSAEEVRNLIDDRLERNSIIKLVMDFSGVTFMDSSGIGVVIGRYKKLLLKKGTLAVTNINETIGRVFELSGMFKIIKVYDYVENAVANL
ncbi:MAG: anti-sigma F factor antagonist [Solirubrobacterales bacterium]